MSGALGCATSLDEPAPPAADTAAVSVRESFKRTAAAHAVEALSDPRTRDAVVSELRRRGPTALAELAPLVTGGSAGEGAVPEAWLQDSAGTDDSAGLLVAYAPSGNERTWTEIPAYTLDGTRVALDPRHPPGVPVLVIETHGRLAMRQGIAEANLALQRAGVQASPRAASLAATGRWTTRLDSIRLADDEEPWISGAAEVYAIVSGVVGDNDPALRIVELPYLDNDGTTYTPNQIVVDWTDYAYQAANLQLFEHDDNTNYQTLVTALVTAVGEIGSLAGYPQIQAITEIANRIIAAMPSGWFSNDDDYVDSYYTLEKTRTYTNLRGAGQNATVSLSPFFLAPN